MTEHGDAVVEDLAFGPDFENTLYATTRSQGVLRAPLGTRIWTPVNSGLGDSHPPVTTSVAVEPGRPFRIAVGTTAGVYLSNDRGNSYPDTLRWGAGYAISDVGIHPLRPHSCFGLSADRILFATPLDPRGWQVQTVAERTGSQFVDLGLWPTSTDTLITLEAHAGLMPWIAGEGFVPRGPALEGPAQPSFHGLRLVGESPRRVLVGSDVGLWESDDLGESWQWRDGGPGARIPEIWAVESPDPTAPALLLGSFTRGFLREDAPGEPWQEQNEGLCATFSRALDVQSGSWLGGDAHGRVFRSSDQGATWNEVTGDLDLLQIRSVCQLRDGRGWLVGSVEGLDRSEDGGLHWSRRTLPVGHRRVHRLLQPAWMDEEEVWAATDRGVLRSRDAGQTWEEVPGLGDLGHPVFAAAAGEDSALVFGADGGALWWGRPAEGFTAYLPAADLGRRYRGLAFIGSTASSLVVSSALPADFSGSGVIYRVDGAVGPTPQGVDLTGSIPAPDPAGGDATAIRVGGTSTVLVILQQAGLVASSDAGASWEHLDAGLPTLELERVATLAASPPRVVVSSAGRGIWSRPLTKSVPTLLRRFQGRREKDAVVLEVEWAASASAELWRRVDPGPWRWWRSLEVEPGSQTLVDESDEARGSLAYELRQENRVLGRVQLAPSAPARLELLANRPNPFNPRTLVRFRSPATEVCLDVYDARGRRVRELFAGRVSAGLHSLLFDGRDDHGTELASGVYLLRLTAGTVAVARRVTLLR
jgi:photosystem II stability/assembly factor-like uncharacterized protein